MIKRAARRVMASLWTLVLLAAVIVSLHAWWFIQSDHKADVISGFGVATAVLGILVAAQPIMVTGVRRTARRSVGLISDERKRQLEEEADAVEAKASRRVIQEQIGGVGLVAIGTLLNGYAPAIARLLSLPV